MTLRLTSCTYLSSWQKQQPRRRLRSFSLTGAEPPMDPASRDPVIPNLNFSTKGDDHPIQLRNPCSTVFLRRFLAIAAASQR